MFPLLLLLLPGGDARGQGADEVQWLKDLRAREGRNLAAQTITSKDAFFTGKLLGKAVNSDIVRDSGAYAIDIDIGSEIHASCEVIVGGFALAEGLREAADRTIREFALLHGTLQARSIDRIDAGVFGSSPYIAVDWLLVVKGQTLLVGALKQIVVQTRGHGLYCAHLEIGYRQSFQATVSSLAQTLRFKDAPTAPSFTEVSVARLQGDKVGVTVLTTQRDAAGVSLVETSTALALPLSDSLQTRDSRSMQRISPNGALMNAAHTVRRDGSVETELALTPAKGGGWVVNGRYEGATLEKTLEPAPVPATLMQQARARRALFTRKSPVGAQLTSAQWTTTDPTRVIESQTTVVSVAGPDRLVARETSGELSTEIVLDRATGLPAKATLTIGPLSLELERVYVQGSF